VQAGVYELIRDDGSIDKVKVLKAKHRYALMTKMQREWEVGRRISSLKNPERAMPGYMSVGPAVCTENGNFKGKLYPPASDHVNIWQEISNHLVSLSVCFAVLRNDIGAA